MTMNKLKTLCGVDIYVTDEGKFEASIPGHGRMSRAKLAEVEREIKRNAQTGVRAFTVRNFDTTLPDIAAHEQTIIHVADQGEYRDPIFTSKNGKTGGWDFSAPYLWNQDVVDSLQRLQNEYRAAVESFQARRAEILRGTRKVTIADVLEATNSPVEA